MNKHQTIKEKLQQYSCLNKELTQLQERVSDLRSRMYSIKSPTLDGMPCGGGNNDKIGEIVTTIISLEDKHYNMINNIFKQQRDIEDMIDALAPVERLLIRARYIECNTWESVCVAIGYSWSQTYRLHSDVLNKLSKME